MSTRAEVARRAREAPCGPDINSGTPGLLTPSSEIQYNPFFVPSSSTDATISFDFGILKLETEFIRSRTPSLTFADEDDDEPEQFYYLGDGDSDKFKGFEAHSVRQSRKSSICWSETDFTTLLDRIPEHEAVAPPAMDTSALRLSEPSLNYEGLYSGKSFESLQADFMRQQQQQDQPQQMQEDGSGSNHGDQVESSAIDPAMQASANMSNFNLSDFLSVGDNEQFQVKQNGQEQVSVPTIPSSTQAQPSEAPYKPLTITTRPQYLRDMEVGPRSEMSSPTTQSNELLGHYVRPSMANQPRSLSFHSGQQTMDPHNIFADHRLGTASQRPTETLFRSHSDLPSISCDPSHVASTASMQSQSASPYYHESVFGQHDNTIQPPPIYLDDDSRVSSKSASPYSSPNTPLSSLWSEDRRTEISPSPLGSYVMTSQSSFPSQSSFSSQSAFPYAHSVPDVRYGMIRAQRLQASSPYGSPMMHATPSASIVQHAAFTGQHISGIITKRSRGRRVPNNPEELNNLGKSGKVYTCKVPGCGKCFKRSEHLKRHVRSIHTDEKPFMCHCGKTFSRHDNLNQHARVHQQGYNSHLASPLALAQSGSLSPAVSAMSLASSPDVHRNKSLLASRLRCAISDAESMSMNDAGSDFFRLDG